MPTVRAFPPLDPLLNARVDPPSYGWSRAATHAYFNQTVQLARLLKRESPNTPGVDGRTALHVAALVGDHAEVAALLLTAGADPSATTRQGHTPLDYALRRLLACSFD